MESIKVFGRSADASVFLFDKELSDYLTGLARRAVYFHSIARQLHDGQLPGGSERSELAKKHTDLSHWFLDQVPVLIEKFKPVLALDMGAGLLVEVPVIAPEGPAAPRPGSEYGLLGRNFPWLGSASALSMGLKQCNRKLSDRCQVYDCVAMEP
jgi:hypothetical protein